MACSANSAERDRKPSAESFRSLRLGKARAIAAVVFVRENLAAAVFETERTRARSRARCLAQCAAKTRLVVA